MIKKKILIAREERNKKPILITCVRDKIYNNERKAYKILNKKDDQFIFTID